MLSVGLRVRKPSLFRHGLRLGISPLSTIVRAPHPSRFTHTVPLEESTHVANIKSQIKRIKTNLKAQERNKAVKSELKTAIRRARAAVATGDKAAANEALVVATKKLDKAVSKGVIHQNQAANRKSALAKQVAAL